MLRSKAATFVQNFLVVDLGVSRQDLQAQLLVEIYRANPFEAARIKRFATPGFFFDERAPPGHAVLDDGNVPLAELLDADEFAEALRAASGFAAALPWRLRHCPTSTPRQTPACRSLHTTSAKFQLAYLSWWKTLSRKFSVLRRPSFSSCAGFLPDYLRQDLQPTRRDGRLRSCRQKLGKPLCLNF